jgi:Family of unknown function (DUF6889)
MQDDEDFVMRPVLRGMCRYESLKDGTIDLVDLGTMNDAISVELENQLRAQDAVNRDN